MFVIISSLFQLRKNLKNVYKTERKKEVNNENDKVRYFYASFDFVFL